MHATLRLTPTDQGIARMLARLAVRALYFEVKVYPKPGLVSFIDSGAHADMNGETFYRSLFTLRHYFYQISLQGLRQHSFEQLKKRAIDAEQAMLAATKGINTHRGAIFAMGLFRVSAAGLIKKKRQFTAIELHYQILDDWKDKLVHHQLDNQSHGSRVRQEYKVIDARQTAIDGYHPVFQLLPSFLALFTETASMESGCLFAYLQLLRQLDDTNILYRKGKAGLKYAQDKAVELLSIDCLHARYQQALVIHQVFSQQGISPGGVADLMAVLLFLGQLFSEQLRHFSFSSTYYLLKKPIH